MPPFLLRNVLKVLESDHENTRQSTSRYSTGSGGAKPSQPTGSSGSRIAEWAAACGQTGSTSSFTNRLDGGQVGGELMSIFRETPEFGRSLAMRLEPFLDESTEGSLQMIGGGGEAVVFYDEPQQQVIKLLAPPGKAAFGWILEEKDGLWGLRAGRLDEVAQRFAWFEQWFPSGLELEQVGIEENFLLLKQPFILGSHPTPAALHAWMRGQGWTPWAPLNRLTMIQDLTWRKEDCIATDVRPENALIAESDGALYAIDFITTRLS